VAAMSAAAVILAEAVISAAAAIRPAEKSSAALSKPMVRPGRCPAERVLSLALPRRN
jgi:hypothetical protein